MTHSSTNLSRSLPTELGKISLATLVLDGSEIKGSIPSTLCNLKNARVISMSSNKLSGGIPRCAMPELSVLNLANNSLTGELPDGV